MKSSRRQASHKQQSSRAQKEQSSSDFLFLVLIVLLGSLLRLDLLIANGFVIDSDEAIVGLMGKHMLEGGKIPTFYYGQHYMGSLEAIIASVYFRFLGVSSQTLKLVPFSFALLLIPISYFLAREISGRFGARVTSVSMAIPPSALVVWSCMARGGFIEIVLIGAIALLLACRWLKAAGQKPFLSMSIGIFLGFGWWVNNQILYFIAAIGLAMALASISDVFERKGAYKTVLCNFLMTVLGFAVGGFPYWNYNIQRGFPSFGIFQTASGSDFSDHLGGFFETAFPILFGAKAFWESRDLYPYSTALVWGFYGVIICLAVFFRRKQIVHLLLGRFDSSNPVELFLLFILFSVLIFAASSFGYLVQAPRYLLPLYVGVFVVTGYVLNSIYKPSPIIARTLALILVGINLYSYYPGRRMIPGEPFVFQGERASKDHAELLRWLKEHQVQKVHTNYWIGYRLAFETQEAVTFSMFQEPRQVRIPWYEGDLNPDLYFSYPFVLVPSQAKLVKEGLDVLGYEYQEHTISGYVVYFGIRPRAGERAPESLRVVSREFLEVSASHKSEDAWRAIDGQVETRWGTGEPQKPGMEFSLKINPPQTLSRITYKLGGWKHDYPREFSIDLESSTGEKNTVLTPSGARALQYLLDRTSDLSLYLDSFATSKVILRQSGNDAVFDWSIAELQLQQRE